MSLFIQGSGHNQAKNPLDGMSKPRAKAWLYKNLLHHTKGMFRDQYWRPINRIWETLNKEGVTFSINSSEYRKDDKGVPAAKSWRFEVSFVDDRNRKQTLYGTVTAAGAGSVKDPLDMYDVNIVLGDLKTEVMQWITASVADHLALCDGTSVKSVKEADSFANPRKAKPQDVALFTISKDDFLTQQKSGDRVDRSKAAYQGQVMKMSPSVFTKLFRDVYTRKVVLYIVEAPNEKSGRMRIDKARLFPPWKNVYTEGDWAQRFATNMAKKMKMASEGE